MSYCARSRLLFCSSRRRHTRSLCDWSSDVCSSDLPVVVDDPVLHRRITVTKANSNTTVVWNPWSNAGLTDMTDHGWRQMLCIEAANVAEDAITIQPREAHVMEAVISVEALA